MLVMIKTFDIIMKIINCLSLVWIFNFTPYGCNGNPRERQNRQKLMTYFWKMRGFSAILQDFLLQFYCPLKVAQENHKEQKVLSGFGRFLRHQSVQFIILMANMETSLPRS